MSQRWFANGITESPASFEEFYSTLNTTIWAICVVSIDKGVESYGTGICVDKRGYILTCNHLFEDNSEEYAIGCHHLTSQNEDTNAKIVKRWPAWDMALLKTLKANEYNYVKMADDGVRVSCGENVFSIANPDEMCGSFMFGTVGYPCDGYDRDKLPATLDMPTEMFAFNGNFDFKVQSHLTAGSVAIEGDMGFLDANVPLIQVRRFCCASGAFGGPVFNSRGIVVGMIIMGSSGQNCYAIHFYAINHFLKLVFQEKIDHASPKKKRQDGAGGSRT